MAALTSLATWEHHIILHNALVCCPLHSPDLWLGDVRPGEEPVHHGRELHYLETGGGGASLRNQNLTLP